MSALLSFEEARARLLAAARVVAGDETLPLLLASGRVLAEPVVSTLDVPPHDNSAMDGYALRATDVPSAGQTLSVSQRIAAGQVGTPLTPGTAARIFTGAPIPPGADCVVMQERCEAVPDGVRILHSPCAGDNVRRRGEDIAQGAVVLPEGRVLSAAELGVVASVGMPTVTVRRRLRVALLATGDELVAPGQPLPAGAIYDSNRYVLHALLQGLGCEILVGEAVEDSLEATRAALRIAAAQADVILTTGGVSVGEEDHVRPAVEAEGELALWKIAIKPGKPLAFGSVRRSDGSQAHFVGLPGNPVSAFVTFLMLVRPFLRACQGVASVDDVVVPAVAGFAWRKGDSRREFLRVRLGADGRLELFPRQGSGVLTSMVWSDGLVDVPPGTTIEPGQTVMYCPLAPLYAH